MKKLKRISEFIDSLPADVLSENVEVAVLSTGGMINMACDNTCDINYCKYNDSCKNKSCKNSNCSNANCENACTSNLCDTNASQTHECEN